MMLRRWIIGLLLSAVSTYAVNIRIDFGDADGGAYNTIARPGQSKAGETEVEGVKFALKESSDGADTGIAVVLADVPGNTDFEGPADWGDNRSTGSYAGPYPALFSSVDSMALSDGFFLKNRPGGNTVTISFSGLDPWQEYTALFYGARGGTAESSSTFTLSGGEPVGASSGTIENILNNATEYVSLSARSTSEGELSFLWISSGTRNSGAALNFLQLSSKGDPVTLGLIAD